MRAWHPKLVLTLALVLPGAGHVALGRWQRGAGFLFFMLLLGWITAQFARPEVSFVGRHAAGFFVYAMSVLDAYRMAAHTRIISTRSF
jgi:hypothetical protein